MDLLLALLLFASATFSPASSTSEPWLDPRLPRSLTPTHYNLFIQPNIRNNSLHGKVSIEMKVLIRTNFIIVHSLWKHISSTKVFVNKTRSLRVIRAFENETNRYWIVETRQPMLPGTAVKLNLEFSGPLLDIIHFPNQARGRTSMMWAITFKLNHTRMIFPNFDEPSFKSRFTITLRHWANSTAVSSMPRQKLKSIDRHWRETTFKQTPTISSFAVGFVVSNFVFRNNTLPDGRPHRVWSLPERVGHVSYTLNATYVVQGFLNRELGSISSLPKIDQFAIPKLSQPAKHALLGGHAQWGDHAQWGVINHDEDRLIFNARLVGDKQRQSNLVNLATELARNYFGLAVSCRWWNHLWLDSGLSRFYALKAAAAVPPILLEEQELKEQGLSEDASNNSRPLVPPGNDTNFFHRIILPKGAALLKMMENFLGANEFKRGIRQYLNQYSFKSARTQDLFNSLQTVAGASMNITEIMNTWVYSMGYPVINIQLLADNKINATQKRFLMDPLADPNSPSSTHGYKWYVPLNYRTKGGQIGRVWMNKTDAVFENLLNAEDNWILFNYNQSGFYRVNYEVALWNNIINQLETDHTVFTDLERSQLLSDALALAQARHLGFDVALNLTLYASKERSLLSWHLIDDAFETIHRKLANTDHFEHYQRYVLNLTTTAVNELTVSDKGTHEQKLLRQKIMALSCSAGHRSCIENTTRLFKAWIQDDRLNAIPMNIRRTVYCNGIANSANESEWNTTFNRFFATERDTTEREALLLGLACTKNIDLLERFIRRSLSSRAAEKLLLSELEKATTTLSANPAAISYVWEWLKVHHEEIDAREKTPSKRQPSAYLAQKVAHSFNTRAHLQEVQDFFAVKDTPRPKRETEERINANIRWMENQYLTVAQWLQQNFPM